MYLLVLHGLYFYVSIVVACVCHMSSSNCSIRCLVELHLPNFFGQCLNARTFVKRRFLLYLCFIILVIIWTVNLMKSVLVSTRRENLTISPVTTPYLDLIVNFESCFGKLGLSDNGAPVHLV